MRISDWSSDVCSSDLAKWRNENIPRLSRNPVTPVMPESIVTKPPSAELRPDQKDEDSLPPYADLDRMLHMLVAEEASVDDVVAKYGFDRDAVARIERLLMLAEIGRASGRARVCQYG